MTLIRVLLADDHPALRMGMRVLLDASPKITVVSEVDDGHDAVQQIKLLLPDVAILDCQLPGLDGVQVAEEIAKKKLQVRVLGLSAYDDDRYLSGMKRAGASGYFL
ncbi:MAG: response regulator transcription factor, partial [Anaerolineae bacterium]|nr:response regulator transcription factor [Anaerolineae bacterium]